MAVKSFITLAPAGDYYSVFMLSFILLPSILHLKFVQIRLGYKQSVILLNVNLMNVILTNVHAC